jgi:hypothetical protein
MTKSSISIRKGPEFDVCKPGGAEEMENYAVNALVGGGFYGIACKFDETHTGQYLYGPLI